MIDVRHEQAAAMLAHAYSRVLQKPACAWPRPAPARPT